MCQKIYMLQIQRLYCAKAQSLKVQAFGIGTTSMNICTASYRARIRHHTTRVIQESKPEDKVTFTPHPLIKGPPPPPLVPPPASSASTPKPHTPAPGTLVGQRRMDGSFYMREFPSNAGLIAYDSTEGKKIFKLALEEGGLEAFFPLSQQFLTQEEPAYCGIGTLCMILNALKVDPAKTWRKPWRWFTQDMLDCCRPLEYVRTNGITLTEFTCLATCNGLEANTKYADRISLEDFRHDIIASTNSASQVMAVSYSRAVLGQTGSGHFSPVGGYSSYSSPGSSGHGYVLILDVARFKYPAYWVSLETLYESLRPIDPVTKLPRGYSLLKRPVPSPKKNGAEGGDRVLLKLGFTKETWPRWFEGLIREVQRVREDEGLDELTSAVGGYLSLFGDGVVTTRVEALRGAVEENTKNITPTAAAAYDPNLTVPSLQAYSTALTSFYTRLSTNTQSLYHRLPPASPISDSSSTATPQNHALTTILLLALYSFPPFLARIPSKRAVREIQGIVEREIGDGKGQWEGREEIRREVAGIRRMMRCLEQCCREEREGCSTGCGEGECLGTGGVWGAAGEERRVA